MTTLSKEFRRLLENAVLKARVEAQRGAAAALESFGVADAKAPGHLDDAGKELRRRLRAHGRQVGDARRADESQEVEHLIHECAYEHWHRMLFARFLAENGFLIEPESGLDVDLDFCEERARETKSDKWEIAAGFAQWMLPGIFRPDDPVLQVRLPAESRNQLTALLASLPRDVFLADDSLGWVYQFWQEKKKDEVNASGKKIGADELAPVTQLFTEDYMVEFLLHNTLGAWWAGRKAESRKQKVEIKTKEEARKACALLGVDWKYLRFVEKNSQEATQRTEGGSQPSVSPVSSIGPPEAAGVGGCSKSWTPAAGAFEGWPKTVKELRVLDPCMGSGHFLVFALVILARMRMAEEGLSAADACVAVLRDNLFGLELDPRCTQIAAFNLALAAWKLGGYQKELPLNLACSGLGLNARKEEWLKLAGRENHGIHGAHGKKNTPAASPSVCSVYSVVDEPDVRLQAGMERLYDLFQKRRCWAASSTRAPLGGDLLVAAFHELQPLLEKALATGDRDDTAHEMAVTARGLAKAAEILAGQFTLVATNVPYLGRGKQDEVFKGYCERVHPAAKADLATCFIERCLDFCSDSGSAALVTPQNWLFLTSYRDLRENLLATASWLLALRLGPGAFETISGEVVKASLVAIGKAKPAADVEFVASDVSDEISSEGKARALSCRQLNCLLQRHQLRNPDSRITTEDLDAGDLLSKAADFGKGSTTGDRPRFLVCYWELANLKSQNSFWLDSPSSQARWCGREHVTTLGLESPELREQIGVLASWTRDMGTQRRRGDEDAWASALLLCRRGVR